MCIRDRIITYLWAFLVLLRRCCYLQAAQYTPSPACGSLRASPPKVTMIFLIVLLVDCCLPMYPGTPILILYLGYTHNPTYICTRKMSLSLPKCWVFGSPRRKRSDVPHDAKNTRGYSLIKRLPHVTILNLQSSPSTFYLPVLPVHTSKYYCLLRVRTSLYAVDYLYKQL